MCSSKEPVVAVIMGSDSDFPILKGCIKTLKDFGVTVEVMVCSAHRTPDKASEFAKKAEENGIDVIIAAAGMAAHLPGVIASMTTLPVIGVPIKASLDGMDALLAIVQMPPGIPVATVGIDGSLNAAILAVQMISTGDEMLQEKLALYKEGLKKKIVKANEELKQVHYKFKTN